MTYELDNAAHEQRSDGTAGDPPMRARVAGQL